MKIIITFIPCGVARDADRVVARIRIDYEDNWGYHNNTREEQNAYTINITPFPLSFKKGTP